MSDTTQTPTPEQAAPAEASPRPAGRSQPTFDEILAAAAAPKPPPQKVSPPPAPPKVQAQPSFDDILAAAASAPETANSGPPAAHPPQRKQGNQGNRGGQPRQGEQRKMPVVVRKIALPKPGESLQIEAAQEAIASESALVEGAEGETAAAPAEGAETAAAPAEQAQGQQQGRGRGQRGGRGGERGERQGQQQNGQKQEPRAAQAREQAPMPESAFATEFADENADFAAMFAESGGKKQGRLSPGTKVKGKIAHLGAEVAFLDLGGKGEGIIDLRELRDDKGNLVFAQGDSVEGFVLSMGEGNVVITKSVPKGAGREVLAAALESRIPVEGVVTAVNKGGLEVELGGQRAFCPTSQVDVHFVEDLSVFVGQKLQFRVTELRGGNAVLSRRAVLEEARKGQAAELRKKLDVGVDLEGTVISVRDFGAFVDLGGLEGMIHVSELSHARVAHAQDVVKVGQKVKVQVLRIDGPGTGKDGKPHGEKIALSLKALEQDPWDAARPELAEGKKLQGKVARLQPFGAFVELFPGVDGLVHVSALSPKHVNHPREVVKEGELVYVQIESVDDQSRRVALRRITEEEFKAEGPVAAPVREGRGGPREGAPQREGQKSDGKPATARAKVGDVVDVTVEKCEAFGVFVTWAGGNKGLIPNPELGTERGSDNKRTNPVGSIYKAQIIEVDDRGRYRLSKTSAQAALDRADYQDYQRKHTQPAGKGFGTLGDLLRAKLAQK
jgi:small subunit ribosomal protein S1